MLVISKPSRWEERREGEGGHEDIEGQWVHEDIEGQWVHKEVEAYRRVNGNG
jgi:hypothetical protein